MIRTFSTLFTILAQFSRKNDSFNYTFPALFSHSWLKPTYRSVNLIAAFIIIVTFTSSCQSSAKKSNRSGDNGNDSTAVITLPPPTPLAKAEADRLNKACQLWFDSALLLRGFNGGMLVAKDGNIVFEKYTGTAHLPGTDLITATTPLHIASVSKTFTAMAILKLQQEGKLNIDDELSKYFSTFNYPGVTIRSLLSHRSGLPNYLYFMDKLGWDKKQMIGNQDVLDMLVNKKALLENITSPNTHFTYCNTNFALLALLIEKITGKKYPDYMAQTFFLPLQMKNTFVYSSNDPVNEPESYDWKGRLIPRNNLDAVYGDKNIYTTPRDLLTWDRALKSGKLFTDTTLAEAYTPYSNEKPGVRNYGLGWRMNIYPDGKKMIYHNGWWHGSNASFIRLLKENATIIVIGNKFTRNIYQAKILCNLFGDYYTGEDEEEQENSKATETPTTAIPSAIPGNTQLPLSKKNEKLQTIFRDKNKVTTH